MNREDLPVIATDIDGVVVKWQSGLPYFAQKYNLPLQHILDLIIEDIFVPPAQLFDCHEDLANKLMKKYNSSDFIRYLAPYSDALSVINRLKSKYRFVAVTALGTDVDSMLNRKFNLQALFPDAFDDIFVCGHNESKASLLRKVNEKYKGDVVAFVDDMPGHVDTAYDELDCPIFWMPRGHRDDSPVNPHKKVRDWNDLEWAIGMSLPVVKKETVKEDTKSLQDILKEFDDYKEDNRIPEISIPKWSEEWVKPMTPCDPPYPYPMTPCDPVYPGVGTPSIPPSKTGDIPEWAKFPRLTCSPGGTALLGMANLPIITG
ncbi:hypothetical protein KNT87_gp207 [Erwinia phage Cronus]|uniref:Uncharacterized protein n=1 Tax=Erwinia phage Cronus TaxID=2163633 RepID=A0A2S1GLV4_9CAUD|nr:hypothetical protein KNT87_gp207 [Erwinia phage Cronus]AWD90362.1 hypothetical protein [Erwinia phage Cronus]